MIMVLSASSVWSQQVLESNDMFGVFKKQFVFALLGLAGGLAAARLPLPVLRRLITPVLVIIVGLIPLALRGVRFRALGAAAVLRRNLLVYGLGGLIAPFVGIIETIDKRSASIARGAIDHCGPGRAAAGPR